jgi:hypothetical protein
MVGITGHQLAKKLLALPDLKIIILKPGCNDEYEYLLTTKLISGGGESNIALKGISYSAYLESIGKAYLLQG